MFSLFQEKLPEDPADPKSTTSQDTSDQAQPEATMAQRLRTLGARAAERLRAAVPDGGRWNAFNVMLAIGLFIAVVHGVHEERLVARLSSPIAGTAAPQPSPGAALTSQTPAGPMPAQARSPEEERLAAQINALNAKLDSLTRAHPAAPMPAKPSPAQGRARRSSASDVTIIHRVPQQPQPDPRWQNVQAQLDDHGRQIAAQGKQIESTRQELVGTRSELQGSIARTHEELVVLQKKGERNYYEFDLDKSKNFRTTGPIGISLRKANTKDQYADLRLMVDDRELSKKHLNLYEPVMFYPGGERQPVELVINSIGKNHVRGYISAPRYKASDLRTVTAPAASPPTNNDVARHRLVEAR